MVRALGGGHPASRRRALLVTALLAATALLALGVAVRVLATHSLDTTNLVWNLFLAWIPFVLALVLYDGARRGVSAGTLVALGGGWLLFLPNAPYIVTDGKWLGEYAGGTHWYDAVLIGAAATSASCSGSSRCTSCRSSSRNAGAGSRAGRSRGPRSC